MRGPSAGGGRLLTDCWGTNFVWDTFDGSAFSEAGMDDALCLWTVVGALTVMGSVLICSWDCKETKMPWMSAVVYYSSKQHQEQLSTASWRDAATLWENSYLLACSDD